METGLNTANPDMTAQTACTVDAIQPGGARIKHYKILDANAIKLIAIIAMTVDHITWAIFPGTQAVWYVFALHVVGRLTAPIMWFFIAEGYHYTHNIKKYLLRLAYLP